MNIESIAERIINLKERDLEFRDQLISKGILGEGYNEEMARIHNENANELNRIIEEIDYPTKEKVGKEAAEAAWLVIQHSIGKPEFMKKCAFLLQKAVLENKADPIFLAYLTDRIATFEGSPQLYGTQFDWDSNGELSPSFYDDIDKVNQRRASLRLNSLQDQTTIIRKRAIEENETPPIDFKARQEVYDQWKKKVGWLKS